MVKEEVEGVVVVKCVLLLLVEVFVSVVVVVDIFTMSGSQ